MPVKHRADAVFPQEMEFNVEREPEQRERQQFQFAFVITIVSFTFNLPANDSEGFRPPRQIPCPLKARPPCQCRIGKRSQKAHAFHFTVVREPAYRSSPFLPSSRPLSHSPFQDVIAARTVTWNCVEADVRPIVLACLHIPVFDLRKTGDREQRSYALSVRWRKNKELDLFGLNAELE